MECGCLARPSRLISLFLVMNTVNGLWLPHLVTEHSEHVQIEISEHKPENRQRRSTDGMPYGIDVTLTIQLRPLTLSLRRISDADFSLPVHLLRNGTVVAEQMNSDETTGFYEDTDREALILLHRHTHEHTAVTDGFTVFGTFCSDSERFIIQRSTNVSTDSVLHTVTKVPQDKQQIFNSDFIVPETLIYKKNHNKQAARSKRQTEQYYIELYMVADYSVYTFWKNRASGTDSQKDSEAKGNIRTFYSYVLHGIDQRYRGITDQTYKIRVMSRGLLILDMASDSPMTESNKFPASARYAVGSSIVLEAFSVWDRSRSGLPDRDHTMLFTNYDIVSGSSGGDSAGIAYVGSLCSNKAQSVIEDEFTPFTMTTAAHELGHSLGAAHDGAGNTCSSTSNYIMAAVNSVGTDPNIIGNSWIFSSCSVDDFTDYISTLDSQGDNCMTDTSPSSALPAIIQPMAEVYPPDDVCILKEGDGSYVCRSIQDYDTLCGSMFCNKPGTSQCYTVLPPEGTSCASGKVCSMGRCVSSPNAPSVPDNCPLGDRPGYIPEYGATCSDYIAANPHRCYTSIAKTCCQSCASIYTGVQGCEYGDKAGFCKSLTRGECYLNSVNCCGYCNRPDIKDTSRPGCEYGDHYSFCSPSSCSTYNAVTKEKCCESCGTTPVITTTTTERTTATTTTKPTSTTTQATTTTKSVFTTPEVTTKPTISTQRPSTVTGTTVIPTEQEKPSDSVIVGVGAGIGVVVIVIVAVIAFIFFKRRGKSVRKQSAASTKSSENTYDKIGIVSPSSMISMPHHPPPRRDNSVTTPTRPLPLPKPFAKEVVRPPNLNFDVVGNSNNDTSDGLEGYMTPSETGVSTISNGVHYTAPNKPKFNFHLPNGVEKQRPTSNHSADENNDSPRGLRRPIHYRRSAASTESNETDRDSKQCSSQSMVKTPGSIVDSVLNKFGNKKARNNSHVSKSFQMEGAKNTTISDDANAESDTYNEISELESKLNERRRNSDLNAGADENTKKINRPQPKLPPKPKPRLSEKGKDNNIGDDKFSKSKPKIPLKPVTQHSDSETHIDDLHSANQNNRAGGVPVLPNLTSAKSSELNRIAQDKDVDGDVKQILKPPLKPPMRPVPRRQKTETKVPQDNFGFEDDNVVAI